MNEIKVIELFGGIGAIRKAFERTRIPFKVTDYVEIDKYAVKSYNAIFNESYEPSDIKNWNKDIYADLIMHGSPCQDFSVAGMNQGGDEGSGTRSSLMYETIRIVKKVKPKYVIWENVKNLLSKKHKHNFINYINELDKIGYNSYYKVLNAKNYGIPQNRERVFTISIRKDIDKGIFEFPKEEELRLKLKDMIEKNVEEKYYLSDKMINYCLGLNQKESKYPRGDVFLKNINRKNDNLANTITTKEGCRPVDNFIKYKGNQISNEKFIPENHETLTATIVKDNNRSAKHQQDLLQSDEGSCRTIPAGTHASTPHLLKTITTNEGKLKIRKLTPKECWRLMGFDDEDVDKASKVNSNTQLYKQAGNSIVVPILEKLLVQLFKDERC